LATGLILLLIGTSIIPITAQDIEKSSLQTSSRGNWLYVGGSGPGNYTKIQDAINDSSDGDTVFVYDDSSPYNEQITVNKSITVQGENKSTTIINDGGFTISANYVTITGFLIQYGRYGVFSDDFSNNIIENCVFYGNTYGVYLEYKSNNNSIRNCSFLSQYHAGVRIDRNWPFCQMNNEISYCDFFDNGLDNYVTESGGILIFYARGTKIHHCNIANNWYCGIFSFRSFAQITSNNIFNNNIYGSSGGGVLCLCSFLDLRSNWWGTSQGPNITMICSVPFLGPYYLPIRITDHGDTVIRLRGLTRLRPWLSEPVPDAGLQTLDRERMKL
jgi:parallel beta-helix repeat protein